MMRRPLHSLATVVALTFLPAALAHAQTVDELVAKNLQAKGGLDVIRQTTSVKITGRFKQFPPSEQQGPPIDLVVTTWAKRPNLMRKEAVFTPPAAQGTSRAPGEVQKQVQASDGTTVWVQNGTNRPQAIPTAQAEPMTKEAEFDGVFVDYQARGITITLVGRETLNERPVYHLKVTRKNGPVQHYFLDAETGLEAKVTTEAQQGDMKATVETVIGDYRSVEGRMVPFSTRQIVDGKPAAEMKVDRVEFNVEMPDSLFKMPPPAAVKPPIQ